MITNYDISQFVNIDTENLITKQLIERFKLRRKELGLSQRELALKSGVSYSSIRRFEREGEISLNSLIKLATSIECLTDFNMLFKDSKIQSLKDYNGN